MGKSGKKWGKVVKSGEKLEKVVNSGKSEKKWKKVGKSSEKWGKVAKVGKSSEKWKKMGKTIYNLSLTDDITHYAICILPMHS